MRVRNQQSSSAKYLINFDEIYESRMKIMSKFIKSIENYGKSADVFSYLIIFECGRLKNARKRTGFTTSRQKKWLKKLLRESRVESQESENIENLHCL